MIHKVITSWIKSTVEEESFTSAWTTILNAIAGAWGDITLRPFAGLDEEMNITVIKNKFTGYIDTEVSGEQTIVTPYPVTDFVEITIRSVTGQIVTDEIVYIVNQTDANPPELTVTLNSGRKIITISGIARRI